VWGRRDDGKGNTQHIHKLKEKENLFRFGLVEVVEAGLCQPATRLSLNNNKCGVTHGQTRGKGGGNRHQSFCEMCQNGWEGAELGQKAACSALWGLLRRGGRTARLRNGGTTRNSVSWWLSRLVSFICSVEEQTLPPSIQHHASSRKRRREGTVDPSFPALNTPPPKYLDLCVCVCVMLLTYMPCITTTR